MQFRIISAFAAELLSASLFMSGLASAQSSWPQFRGPEANPIADNERLPDQWSTTENVEWATEIPGRGWSSPIVAAGKIFLTTVTTDGKSKVPQVGTEYGNEFMDELLQQGFTLAETIARLKERDNEMPEEVNLHYLLVCLDLESGRQLWQHEFYAGKPPGGRHRKNSYTSETPVTDGNHLYVYVANLGLFVYDQEGQPVWQKKLKPYPVYEDFGSGTSPILVDGRLIIVNDNEQEQFIAAFDKTDGKLTWRRPRELPPNAGRTTRKSGWSTPFIWSNSLRTEIVTVAPDVAISYDLEGNELWRMTGMSMVPSASSFAYEELLYLNGGKGQSMYAIRAGAAGDITHQKESPPSEYIVWEQPRAGTFVPSAVAYRGGLYVLKDNGIISRFDAKSGEQSFKSRIRAFNVGGADFTASPWAYNNKVFCLSEQGETYVFAAGSEHELLYVNSLGDMALASPAIVGDRLLIRTEKRLYSIRRAE